MGARGPRAAIGKAHVMMHSALGALIAALVASAIPLAVHAEDAFPARPVTMIVPFAAGGSSDVIARIVGEELGRVLGQRIVHENMAGAGGSTGLARAATAAPDGYTIAIGNAGTNAAAYTIYPELKYGPSAFEPIGLVAKTAAMIAIRRDFPDKSLQAFIANAHKNPGAIRLGHAGVGSSNYLICKSFVLAAKIDITLVSYRGGAPALNDAIGGHIDGVCDAASSVSPSIAGGQVHGLVVAASERLPNLPDVPTAAEAKLPEFTAGGWNALFAPAGTPAPIIAALHAATAKALAGDIIGRRFADIGAALPVGDELSTAYLKRYVPAEIEKYKVLLQAK